MDIVASIVGKIFEKQVKYKDGRHFIDTVMTEPERMQWVGSKHLTILTKNFYDKFGEDYLIEEYLSSKVYGHIFCSQLKKFGKFKKFVAPLLSLTVKRFGYGSIEGDVLDYKQNKYRFYFYDSPTGREFSKLYGKSKIPLDFMLTGLVAGSAEQLLGTKMMGVETTCLAKGDDKCTLLTLPLELVKKEVLPTIDTEFAPILKKIIKREEKEDMRSLAADLLRGQNKKFLLREAEYLKWH
jgi:hypothetical protein